MRSKSFFIAVSLFSFLQLGTIAQTVQNTSIKDIPTSVQQNLMKFYPDLNSTVAMRHSVNWKKDNGGFIADFTYRKQVTRIVFDGSGKINQTGRKLRLSDTPEKISSKIRSERGGKSVSYVWEITKGTGTDKGSIYEYNSGGKVYRLDNNAKELKN